MINKSLQMYQWISTISFFLHMSILAVLTISIPVSTAPTINVILVIFEIIFSFNRTKEVFGRWSDGIKGYYWSIRIYKLMLKSCALRSSCALNHSEVDKANLSLKEGKQALAEIERHVNTYSFLTVRGRKKIQELLEKATTLVDDNTST